MQVVEQADYSEVKELISAKINEWIEDMIEDAKTIGDNRALQVYSSAAATLVNHIKQTVIAGGGYWSETDTSETKGS